MRCAWENLSLQVKAHVEFEQRRGDQPVAARIGIHRVTSPIGGKEGCLIRTRRPHFERAFHLGVPAGIGCGLVGNGRGDRGGGDLWGHFSQFQSSYWFSPPWR